MGEEAPAPPATTPSKAAGKAKKKKLSTKRANRDAPTLSKQIVAVIANSKERKGTSVSAMKRVLASQGVDVPKVNKRINTSLVALVAKGVLSQTTGIGASGSFKLAKKEPVDKKPRKTKDVKKKPAPKKPTTTTGSTAAVTGRKSTMTAKKRRVSGKSDKKPKKLAKKPAAKKIPKLATTPRKTTTSRAKLIPKSKKETQKKGRKSAVKKSVPKKGKKAPAKKTKK